MKSAAVLTLASLLATAAIGAEPASLADAVAQSKVSLNARLRYEGVQQTGLLDANALTLRTRLGFTTAKFAGWQFSAEGENVAAFDGDAFNQSGLNPAAARRAVVADPETTELNQLWLAYSHDKTTATLGRQKLILDNARFVGDVGWRQNQQTFDAFVVQDKSLKNTTLTYAYLDQINRVFSRRHAQGRWDSESHVVNAAYTDATLGTVTGYAYLLDFANSAANSCATYGVSLVGAQKLSDALKFTYRAELATQANYGSSTLNYSALYNCVEAGLAGKPGSVTLGHELLGSDNNVGFKTPLATLHAFNGWADLFLATPAAGLRDVYVKGTAALPQAVVLTAFHHWFEAAKGGADFGTETDVMLSRKFGKYITATAKFADFRRDSLAFPDVRKVWLQVEFVY
ncbi:MAG: alginate export family protein [Opitutae bacterium]|nr:alginate export family protein [Opitutae bacterium]